jgi:hypothetical protein
VTGALQIYLFFIIGGDNKIYFIIRRIWENMKRNPDHGERLANPDSKAHIRGVMAYLRREEEAPRCLHCGGEVYGRTDKVFCSQACKDRYHYLQKAESDRYRRRVLMNLQYNYSLLDAILARGEDSRVREDLEELGFKPACITGFRKRRDGHIEYRCFDISYSLSDARIYRICRISAV